mmetsp:Transcript_206/g.898  ORF Transcript_206/g.898 Transcript_206/m.898 type:complete len:349 (-) Transcript_206:127-1173(-)
MGGGPSRAIYGEPRAERARAGAGAGAGAAAGAALPLAGAVAVVTGANTGLGKETAGRLAAAGAKVVFACRSEGRAREAIADVRARRGVPADRAVFMPLDLTSLKSVVSFAKSYKAEHNRCDALVCNAAINGFTAKTYDSTITEDGFNVVWQVNFLGHWLLARLLQEPLAKANGRVVMVTSCMHAAGSVDSTKFRRTRGCRMQYETTKLAAGLAARELTRRAAERGERVVAHAATPGAVMTDIFRDLPNRQLLAPIMRCMFLSPEQGADTSVAAASDPRLAPGASDSKYLVPYWHAGITLEPLRTMFDTWGWHVGAIEGVAHASMRGAAADAAARELCALADADIEAYL